MGHLDKPGPGQGALVLEEPLVSAYVMPHPTRPNEDAFCVSPLRLEALDRVLICGVYDGHNGSEVSHFLAANMPSYVKACGERELDTAKILEWAFQAAESALANAMLNCPSAGSTATAALLTTSEITVANSGDSRALLCRGGKVIALTEDHRPARPDERARILDAGGQILWNEGERVMGVLATTRGFGDRDLRQFGVTSEPEITTTQRSRGDELLILATDGVFNVLSNEEVGDIARRIVARSLQRGLSCAAAVRLAASAIARFSRDRNSKDDITVLVVDLTGGESERATRGYQQQQQIPLCCTWEKPLPQPQQPQQQQQPASSQHVGAVAQLCRTATLPAPTALGCCAISETSGNQWQQSNAAAQPKQQLLLSAGNPALPRPHLIPTLPPTPTAPIARTTPHHPPSHTHLSSANGMGIPSTPTSASTGDAFRHPRPTNLGQLPGSHCQPSATGLPHAALIGHTTSAAPIAPAAASAPLACKGIGGCCCCSDRLTATAASGTGAPTATALLAAAGRRDGAAAAAGCVGVMWQGARSLSETVAVAGSPDGVCGAAWSLRRCASSTGSGCGAGSGCARVNAV